MFCRAQFGLQRAHLAWFGCFKSFKWYMICRREKMIQLTIILNVLDVMWSHWVPLFLIMTPPLRASLNIPKYPSLQFFNSIQLKAGWRDSIFQSLQTNPSRASLISLPPRSQSTRELQCKVHWSEFHCSAWKEGGGDGGVGLPTLLLVSWAWGSLGISRLSIKVSCL